MARRPSGVENAFDPAAHARGRLRLCRPNWLQNDEKIFGLYLVDWFAAYRSGVSRQRVLPLLAMLGVLPPMLFCLDELIGERAESWRVGWRGPFLRDGVFARGDRLAG